MDKKFAVGLSEVEETRYQTLERKLDELEKIEFGDYLDELENLAERYEFLAKSFLTGAKFICDFVDKNSTED